MTPLEAAAARYRKSLNQPRGRTRAQRIARKLERVMAQTMLLQEAAPAQHGTGCNAPMSRLKVSGDE